MQLKQVNDNFYIADQLSLGDLGAIAAKGIRTLICNRPDSEMGGLPSFAEFSQRAAELHLDIHYLPVVHATINSDDVRAFTALVQTVPAPVLAWCRSGQRSLTLWSLSRIQLGEPSAAVVTQAAALGFDFSSLPGRFAEAITELTNNSGSSAPAHKPA